MLISKKREEIMLRRRKILASVGGILVAPRLHAQTMSPAQIALFETPHLASLRVPTRLEYDFLREEQGRDPVADIIRLDIRPGAEEGRRDVVPEFLTGPRRLPYPPASGFRGNPLLLFALDRDARELAAATGGSMHWFRERIRRAFAEAAESRDLPIAFEGRDVPASAFHIRPFGGEPRARGFQARRYAFVLAEAVPGMVHSIRSETPTSESGPGLRESIVFRAAIALAEEARP
jgi:hypothetical protein